MKENLNPTFGVGFNMVEMLGFKPRSEKQFRNSATSLGIRDVSFVFTECPLVRSKVVDKVCTLSKGTISTKVSLV